ncbi:hypothetical protein [Zoogloea ramigera]|uniref:hypothetical protein n=1 Tax=Zoogloea ramigera TaxID=350 RepID=UPI003FA1B376
MSFDRPLPPTTTERGIRVALIFPLPAERRPLYWEPGRCPPAAQATSLAADWLGRSKRQLAVEERRRLAALSDKLARQIEGSVSREAGLFISHEMNEALDPNHQSELALSLMAECERLLDEPGEA